MAARQNNNNHNDDKWGQINNNHNDDKRGQNNNNHNDDKRGQKGDNNKSKQWQPLVKVATINKVFVVHPGMTSIWKDIEVVTTFVF